MKEKIIQRKILICIIITSVVLLPFLLLPFAGDNTKQLIDSMKYDVSAYFVDEDGRTADLGSLPSGEADYYLRHTTPQGMFLCFQSKSVDFEVYNNGQLIYKYYPEVPKVYGRGYGKMYHYVSVLASDGPITDIRIHTHSATKDGKSYLKDIYFADPADYMAEQMLSNMPNFLICFFIFILGISLITGSLALKPDKNSEYSTSDQKHRLEILSMGVFALCAAAWSGTETDVMQIITQNPSGVHLISYFSLMMLPVPTVLFIASMTDALNRLIVKFISYGTLLNFLCVLISVCLGGPDYHDMLIITHIFLSLAIITDFILIVRSIKNKTISKKTILVITVSFIIVLVSGILDIIRYRFVPNSTDTSSIFRIGMMLFVVILSVYEVIELMRYTRYKEEAYTMERLANTDSLTKLNNRTAYNHKIKTIQGSPLNSGVIVYMDINNLKAVNDNYGHDEGDRHIKAAADIIKRAFREEECYRIGGDEFAVIMRIASSMPDMTERKQLLADFCKEYNDTQNPPIALNIAFGSAVFDSGDKILEAQRTADDLMYENKKELKEST